MTHSPSVFTQLALVFVQLSTRLAHLDLGQLDKAEHRIAGVHDHARPRPPTVFRSSSPLQFVKRRGLLLQLDGLALRVPSIIDSIPPILPSPITPRLMLRALGFTVGLRCLTSLLGHFGAALLQKALQRAPHAESIPSRDSIVKRRQRVPEALQVPDVIMKLRPAAIDVGAVLGTLPAALRLRTYRDETDRHPKQKG